MKTIKINDKDYDISFIDTMDTIKNMIALRERIFTNFIKYTVYKPKSNNIQLDILSNHLVGVELNELPQIIDELHSWDIPESDIALEWLFLNRSGKVENFDLELHKVFQKINSVNFWGADAIGVAYKAYNSKKTEALEKLAVLVNQEQQFRTDYSKYEPLTTTKFLQDSVIIEYRITITLDPLEAFDSINLNSNISYVRLKTADQTYYKLLKTLVPPNEWLEGDSTLVFKIYRKEEKESWGTATIDYIGDTEPYQAIMVIESTVGSNKGEKKTSEEEIRNSIINIFTGADIKITNREEKGVKGVFAIPEMSISRDVFLDLITNNPMVSHYLYVDETRDLSSKKGVLYLYYSPGDSESQIITVFLSERTASRSDIFYTSKELLLFTPYLNVRVARAMNLDQIENFKQAFAVILNVYKKNFDSIAKSYEAVIPGFKNANTLVHKRSAGTNKRIKALQAQDSELFIHGYPTSCERKRQPIPILNKDQKKFTNNRQQIMNYPKNSRNFFICSTENKYIFPGLMKNKLNNSEEYPYLPCCYPNNQKTGRKTLNVYLKDLTKVSHSKTTNIVIKKAVEEGKLGYLPRNIHHILHQSAGKGEKFRRQGVAVSNNSFIEVVLLALDPIYEKTPNKPSYIKDFRVNLASIKISSIIQELYDIDQEKFIKDILDPEVIFDSKLFIGLLEAYYGCQIVVFTRSDHQPNGEFEIPRYTQGYLYNKLSLEKKTVLVYKHMGMRSDNLENPHYELIVKKCNKITTWYFENDILIRKLYSYFLQSYKLYLIGIGRYAPITVPPLANAIGQVIDRYGKTRGYTFKDNVYMVVSPLMPADDIDVVDAPTVRPTFQKILAFSKSNRLKVTQQDISEGKAIGISVNIHGIPYSYLPFKPTSVLQGIPKAEHLGFSIPTKKDILKKTLHNRKIADYLMQLILYGFSVWYADQIKNPKNVRKQEEIDQLPLANQQVSEKVLLLGLVDQYLNKKLIIISKHNYNVEDLPRRLTINNSFFQNSLLVTDSEETYNRLGYYLRFMISKNKILVQRYSERTYLNNYYTYADDFQERKGQLIFVGGLSVSNWIETQEHGVSNQIHAIPHPYLAEPFFFSHWALNAGKPVIFQNVKNGNYGRALSVAAKYAKDNINVGHDSPAIKEINHTVYFFEYGVLMKDGTSPIKIWKFGEDFYAAILVP
uniref:Early transcription factor large subunit-like protein n=1 Tax=Marseillevirus LCMAC201 TaxID=2506605 RepID=A0A481YWP1_9VIRU|nr:MAG: early transcription factor large subunit-like protein [Marseillevirus LCMAC201]